MENKSTKNLEIEKILLILHSDMGYVADIEYDLSIEYPSITGYYTSLGYHRDGKPKKSRWLISVDEEIHYFVEAKHNNWISDDHRGWGINTVCKVLGKTQSDKETYIARFEENRHNLDHWHGYPANLECTQDIPLEFILLDWLRRKYIRKSQYSKIRRGIL